ncbi:MAG: hypothetical protein N2110_05940 [Flavobacteriales bacterium]|nr:hypothetical protein [Flavobacteriales bacterium]MCX7768545.1 hypothetical protein [Flavobacteriales bacterium]MDW8409486.1 choice-of-anchor V domain-containing protein [Flavobacteriales bacterium]
MKKVVCTSFLLIAGVICVRIPELSSRSNGLQLTSNYTGAPGFSNCTQCHSGTPNSGTGSIEVIPDVPSTGYVPGQTYQISVVLKSSGNNQAKYGFMLAAMQGNSYKGTLQAIDNSCAVEPNGRWITHTPSGNTGGTSTKIFTFNWVAPAPGTGNVNLYAAGNCANGNGSDSGDLIYYLTTPVVLAEQQSTSEAESTGPFVTFHPNPVRDQLQLLAPGRQLEAYAIFDLTGALRKHGRLPALSQATLDLTDLSMGSYIILVRDHQGHAQYERLIKY